MIIHYRTTHSEWAACRGGNPTAMISTADIYSVTCRECLARIKGIGDDAAERLAELPVTE